MIQRIQTVFLFLSGLLALTIFAFDIAIIEADGMSITVNSLRAVQIEEGVIAPVQSHYYIAIIVASIAILSAISIALFKNRKLQMNLCQLNIVLSVALLMLIFFVVESISGSLGENVEAMVTYGVSTYLPLVILIANFLAFRYIRKDENLVRSADRLR